MFSTYLYWSERYRDAMRHQRRQTGSYSMHDRVAKLQGKSRFPGCLEDPNLYSQLTWKAVSQAPTSLDDCYLGRADSIHPQLGIYLGNCAYTSSTTQGGGGSFLSFSLAASMKLKLLRETYSFKFESCKLEKQTILRDFLQF